MINMSLEDSDIVSRRNEEAERMDNPGWAIWVGEERGDGRCVAVVADSQEEAEQKALADCEYDEARHVDGPFQNSAPGVWEFEYVTEHRERVVIEAPTAEYAEETADAERDYRGELIQTLHKTSRRIAEKDDDAEPETYRDPQYCCMDCGCEIFEETSGLNDRCTNCGSLRDNKRGPESV